MVITDKYGIRQLRQDFGSDEACLEFLFEARHSQDCSCGGTYRLLRGRRQYQCSKCRFQIAPTSGSIFHKSDTPLSIWFYAIYLFSNAKSGLSAKQLERDLNVTYKTAHRILKLIRRSLSQSDGKLSGDVEMDEAYFGGKGNAGKDNKDLAKVMAKKSLVIGAVERRGRIKTRTIPGGSAKTVTSFLLESVDQEGRLLTDDAKKYQNAALGYRHETVRHSLKEYVYRDVHTNTIEGFWSHLKRSLRGVHKSVSKAHFSEYVDGFVFHYNNRHSDRERFGVLLGTLALASR